MADNLFADALRSQGFGLAPGWGPKPPKILLALDGGVGDDLLCTAVLRELRKRERPEIWMMSHYPDLFSGNRDLDVLVPFNQPLVKLIKSFGCRVIVPLYAPYNAATDRCPIPELPIIAYMCRELGITGHVALRPYYVMDPSERTFGSYSPRQIAIQSTCMGARFAMINKEWRPERFQEVVDALKDEFTFVQLGLAGDPPLQNVIDLRGKTSLRQTAAVLSHSFCFVGLIGMLMHLARAVNCRSVIVFGGRELPWQSGYSCNENISTQIHCSPCWRWHTCGENHACLMQIQSPTVVEAVRRQFERAGTPLAEDSFVIPK